MKREFTRGVNWILLESPHSDADLSKTSHRLGREGGSAKEMKKNKRGSDVACRGED